MYFKFKINHIKLLSCCCCCWSCCRYSLNRNFDVTQQPARKTEDITTGSKPRLTFWVTSLSFYGSKTSGSTFLDALQQWLILKLPGHACHSLCLNHNVTGSVPDLRRFWDNDMTHLSWYQSRFSFNTLKHNCLYFDKGWWSAKGSFAISSHLRILIIASNIADDSNSSASADDIFPPWCTKVFLLASDSP